MELDRAKDESDQKKREKRRETNMIDQKDSFALRRRDRFDDPKTFLTLKRI